MGIYILFIAIAIASFAVQASLKSKFNKYSKVPLDTSLRGLDVASRMLQDHGLGNVRVTSTSGSLTDFYNPTNQSVNLSESVYNVNSIAAAAVAAHECGHAVQHAYGYGPLTLRTKLVPVVSFASQWMSWVLLAGIALFHIFPALFWVGIGLFALTTLFSLVTLPVEIDASRRAIKWLDSSGIVMGENIDMARSALRAAAYTYVVAALGSIATLVYYIAIANRR